MRALAIFSILAVGLTGCALGGRDGGLATYDALAEAQRKCAAEGGKLVRKDEGNAARIDAFACERK